MSWSEPGTPSLRYLGQDMTRYVTLALQVTEVSPNTEILRQGAREMLADNESDRIDVRFVDRTGQKTDETAA